MLIISWNRLIVFRIQRFGGVSFPFNIRVGLIVAGKKSVSKLFCFASHVKACIIILPIAEIIHSPSQIQADMNFFFRGLFSYDIYYTAQGV